jgi:hypothetical protein
MNSVPLRSSVAVNNSPKVLTGSLREIHVSVTGYESFKAQLKLYPSTTQYVLKDFVS